MRLFRCTLLLSLLLLAGGCARTEGARPAPPQETIPAEVMAGGEEAPPPPTEQIPGATLSSQGGQQRAALGSYCWGEAEATLCGDTFALLVPSEPLVVSLSEPLTFTLEAGVPSFVTMRVLQWQPSGESAPADTTAIDLSAPLLSEGDLEPGTAIPWEAPPQPGAYVLDMNSVYADGSSIAYGWHLVVR